MGKSIAECSKGSACCSRCASTIFVILMNLGAQIKISVLLHLFLIINATGGIGLGVSLKAKMNVKVVNYLEKLSGLE